MEIQISRIKRAHSTFHMINKKIQNDCYEKMKGFSLAGGLEGNDLFPEGLILKLLLPGETFYSFLLDGKLNYLFLCDQILKKNMIVEALFFRTNRIKSISSPTEL